MSWAPSRTGVMHLARDGRAACAWTTRLLTPPACVCVHTVALRRPVPLVQTLRRVRPTADAVTGRAVTRDWWDTPPTRIHIRFNADQIHADTTAWNTPRIQLDDGQNRVTLHPTDQTALTELHNLIGILLDQLDTTRP